MTSPRRGVYPGSFNPPTIAHIAIAEIAAEQRGLTSVTLAVSRVALAKESVVVPDFDDRIAVLENLVDEHPLLELFVTDLQLLVDISEGFDTVILGADKWHQIQDLSFYADAAARDDAMRRLPTPTLFPRSPHPVDPAMALQLTPEQHALIANVSSSAARDGNLDFMAPHAREFDARSGAWTDRSRYARYRSAGS